MDEYADILSEIRAEKGIQKVPSVQEPFAKTPVETETNWYDNMIDQSKKVGKLVPELEIKLPEEKSQISPLLSPVLAAPEIAGQLTWGALSWLPSKITGMGVADLMKLSNALLESEQKSKGRTPEERASLREIEPFSSEKIREMAEKTEAWWHIMPEPATKEAKDILGKVGKGLDWLLGPLKTADEYYTKKGYPIVGYHLRAIGEGLYFKGLHGIGVKTGAKFKALRKKLVKKAPVKEIEKRMKGVLDEVEITKELPKGEEIKRVTKSQKIKAHKIQREQGLSKVEYMEIAERLTGETSIKDMNRESAKKFIEELKKGKETLKTEPEPKVEFKPKEDKVKKAVVDTAESLAKEFDLRYMGESEGLEYYSMKVPDGETTLTTKGISRDALVKRVEEVKEQFKIEKVKEEITEPIVEKPEEVKDAEEVRREVREAGEKERIEREEERQVRLRDVERDRLEARAREAKEEIVEEPISETAARAIADDIITLEDMGFYAEVSEMLGEGMKVGTIMKELKQKPYYKEDMADFGYTEKDIRSAIRAAKTEIGDIKAVKDIQKEIVKEEKAVERIEKIEIEPKMSKNIKNIYNEIMSELPDYIKRDVEVESIRVGVFPVEYRGEGGRTKIIGKLKEPEKYQIFIEKGEKDIKETLRHELLHTYILKHPERLKTADGIFSHEKAVDLLERESVGEVPLERVDPITGRPPGMERAFERPEKLPDEAVERYLLSQQPLTGETGKVLKTKFAAERRAKDLGKIGELVENPKGEGWLIKESREERVRRDKAEAEQWETILKEEEGELRPEEDRVDVDVDTFADIVKGERGAIIFHPDSIKKLKKLIKKGLSRDEIIAGLKQKGATDKDIAKLFSAISVRIPIGESKWLKKGQSPLEFLPARTVGKTKEGKVLKAPAVTREDAHIVATTTDLPSDVGKGLKKAPIGEKLRWAPSEGIFTQLGKPLREVFYRRMIKAHKKSSDYAKELLTEAKKLNRIFSLGSRELHSERLNIYEVAQQPDGIERLRFQGVTKIPKLTPKEKVVYEARQKAYKKLGEEINKARVATGKRPFPPVENYTMWTHDMSKLKDFERISAFDKLEKIQAGLDRIRNIPSQIDKLGRTTTMKGHEKLRAGPDMPGYLILDSAENYNVYAKLAADVIHESHDIAYMHELLNVKFGLSEKAPNTYKFLSEWLDFQKGHEPIMFIENPKARRLLRTTSGNVAVAYLTYGARPAIVQLASLSLSYSKLGERFMAEGVVRLLSPFELKRAARESNILTTRSPEEILIDTQRVYPFFKSLKGRTISKGWGKTKRTGSIGLRFTDSIVSYLTWLGAEAKGKSLYKKLSKDQQQAISIKDFSKNYADDITVQCQGSAARAARAPLQRHAEGKFITTLGTFTIANFDYITRHLMGIKNPDITKPQVVASAIRFVLASTIISSIFTDVLRLKSPIPTPIDAFRESLETDSSTRKAFQASVTELLEFIPIYGGKYKFDSELMGPVVDQLVKLGKGDYSSLGRLGGMPGYQALWKAYRAERQGGTAIDMIMGRYLEPSKGITSPKLIKRGESIEDLNETY